MRRFMAFLAVLLFLLPTAAAGQTAAAAAAEEDGFWCRYDLDLGCGPGGLGTHTTSWGSGGIGLYGKPNHDGDCHVCMSGGQPQPAAECHECLFDDDEDPQLAVAYKALLKAADAREISSLLALAPKAQSRVTLNHERSSLQILSCEGSAVIANITIDRQVLAALDRELSLMIVAAR